MLPELFFSLILNFKINLVLFCFVFPEHTVHHPVMILPVIAINISVGDKSLRSLSHQAIKNVIDRPVSKTIIESLFMVAHKGHTSF